LFLVFIIFLLSFDGTEVFPSEATTKLERLHAAVDAFLDFLGVAPGPQEERIWNARRRVLDAIKSGVRRGTRVALAIAEVSVEVNLTGVDGFPAGEELHRHEGLEACYGLAREAVAAHVPAAKVLARLPSH
jgi:hypothetical protein